MKYRSDIDGLRAVAVLPVVFYHGGVSFFSGGFVASIYSLRLVDS